MYLEPTQVDMDVWGSHSRICSWPIKRSWSPQRDNALTLEEKIVEYICVSKSPVGRKNEKVEELI